MSEVKESSFYKENIPNLIEDLKIAIENNRKVITQDVVGDLSEDKYVNVLKARRMAAEDTIFFLKEVDRLENELNEVVVEEKERDSSKINPSKKYAQR